MKAVLSIENLEKEIKRIIKETIQEEMCKLRAELVPYVSDEEQKATKRLYKKPSRRLV